MILILIAMLTVSMAFFSGLYIQGNLPFFPSLIGGFAIFLTLYGTLPHKKTAAPGKDLHKRLSLFENEIVNLTSQLDRFSGLSGKIGQLDQLTPTLQQLEGFLQEMKTQGVALAHEQGTEKEAGTSQMMRDFSEKLKQIDGQIALLNEQASNQGSDQQLQLQTQIQSLDQMVRQMTSHEPPPSQPMVQPTASGQFDPSSIEQEVPPAQTLTAPAAPEPTNFAPEPGAVLPSQSAAAIANIHGRIDSSTSQLSQNADGSTTPLDEQQLLNIISKAIQERRVDIYLQPVVALPKRNTLFYEVFTRLRNESGNLIMPELFVPVAEQAGLMPLIDNMMLLRAIRIIRQMDKRTSAKALFCSLSTQSLVDPDFFPKLVGFLEKNRDLSGRIIFEISQAQKKTAGPIERDGMHRLAMLGYHFSLDKVTDLDLDFAEIARMNFKYVRISADRLVNGMAELGARIHGADKAHYLERYGLHLIVERIETERQLATLADYSIKLGQGYLFAEPRPIRPEILGENAA